MHNTSASKQDDQGMRHWPQVWKSHTVLPDGHRLFPADTIFRTSNDRELIAIADDSGTFPEQTDDGILWLDFDRALTLPRLGFMRIPVMTPDSEEKSVPTDAPTIMCLSWKYGWDINVHGITMRAVRP